MAKKAMLGFTAALCVLSYAGPASASVCGPNNRLVSVTKQANGKNFYNCRCVDGYVPLTTATIWGKPPRSPGCVRVKGPAAPAGRPQMQARGSYRAEPAREKPPEREAAPPPKQSSPDAPPRKTPAALGTTKPAQAPERIAKVDPVAPKEVPPSPQLGGDAWSKSFPGANSPAALKLDQQSLDRLRPANKQPPHWIGEKKDDDRSISTILSRMPLAETLRNRAAAQADLIRRYKGLLDSNVKDTKEYFTGFFRVARETVACVGSTRTDCESEQEEKVESVQNKYADREGGRWKSWLRKDKK